MLLRGGDPRRRGAAPGVDLQVAYVFARHDDITHNSRDSDEADEDPRQSEPVVLVVSSCAGVRACVRALSDHSPAKERIFLHEDVRVGQLDDAEANNRCDQHELPC